MADLTLSLAASSPFDAMRRTRPDGSEFWSARELQPVMGYSKWQDFLNVIERAKVSAANTGVDVTSAFVQVAQLMGAHNLGDQRRSDFELNRLACYLTAMNGDPRKPAIASAQAYFAVRTREAETGRAVQGAADVPLQIERAVKAAVNALAELAHKEHVVPAAAKILAFQRWRKPRRGIGTFVQLTIDLNLPGVDLGAVGAAADRKAIEAGDAA